MKEWLLIVWLGTTTNLQVLDRFPTERACKDGMVAARVNIESKFTLECTSDLREGRSALPPRSLGTGIVK
ncbi:MAG: hypothetical protein O2848_02665 [Proteobacteria bacterium]|jgi:hypothetical protein|nr:hypothetical protein [Pseudomonadota bacterium]MDA0847847.1 hypothetical protein [Pseudomonadota bacterium]